MEPEMILLTLLALGQPAAAPPPPAEDPELVVVAQKVRKMRYRIGTDRKTGAAFCKIGRSSGDARIDARICALAKACVPAKPTKDDAEPVRLCIETSVGKVIAEFAAERRAAAVRR
jgi:hypothetical protein